MSTRIVVGIDGSQGSTTALNWAAQHAVEIGAPSLVAIVAVESPLAWIDVGSGEEQKMMLGATAHAEQQVTPQLAAVAATHPNLQLDVQYLVGEPAETLIGAVAAGDLLVLGSRGRGRFAGAMLGSVGQRCAQYAPCPVVIVPDPTTPRRRHD